MFSVSVFLFPTISFLRSVLFRSRYESHSLLSALFPILVLQFIFHPILFSIAMLHFVFYC
jgi:hypothetical protein